VTRIGRLPSDWLHRAGGVLEHRLADDYRDWNGPARSLPHAYDNISYGSTITLSGTAVDPEGDGSLIYTWTAFWETSSAVLGKSPPKPQWRPRDTIDFLDYNDGDILEVQLRLDVRDQEGNVGLDSVWLRFRVNK
jgi:hypothetical protein